MRPIAVIRSAHLCDSSAAVAVGRVLTSNSRCRPHCSRSGPSVATPATSGIKGTADIAGGASASTRSPAGQSSASAADWRRSKPNVCCPSTRPVAPDPLLPLANAPRRAAMCPIAVIRSAARRGGQRGCQRSTYSAEGCVSEATTTLTRTASAKSQRKHSYQQ